MGYGEEKMGVKDGDVEGVRRGKKRGGEENGVERNNRKGREGGMGKGRFGEGKEVEWILERDG